MINTGMMYRTGINYVGTDGNPCKRTPLTHPYSYESFVSWEKSGHKATGGVYTDRLIQWDSDKHDELCQRHFGNKGQYWDKRGPSEIEGLRS